MTLPSDKLGWCTATQDDFLRIRELRLQAVDAQEAYNWRQFTEKLEEAAAIMVDKGITSQKYAEWSRQNPVRKAIAVSTPEGTIEAIDFFLTSK